MAWFKKNKNQGTLQNPGKERLTLDQIATTGGQLRIRDVSNQLWFPAGQPIPPVAPRGTPPRRYAYQPMTNINWATRDGQIDHLVLRNFSYYPIVRDIIETLKDLLVQIEWDFFLLPKDGETGAQAKKRAQTDKRLQELRKFFKKPDGWQPFKVWSRGLYDDMLVLDAASIWKQKDKTGKVCSLVQIDGAQVFPLIDETGQEPDASPYDRVLVQTSPKKADEEYKDRMKKAATENGGRGSPAYQLTPYGFPAQEMTAEELTYAVYNRFTYRRYGFSKVEVCLAYIAIALGRLDFQAAFYRSGNVPEGIAFLPPDVPIDKVDELNKYLDTILAGNLRNRRKIFFLPSYGTDKQPNLIFPKINDQVLKDEFDEWLARVLCHCFGLSPMAFTKQINRGEAKNQQQAQGQEGVAPCIGWMKDVLDGIIQNDLGYDDIEAKPQPRPEQDVEKLTGVCVNQFNNGIATLNEVRDELGYDTIDEEWANVPLCKTANGYVRLDGLMMDGSEPPDPTQQDTVPGSAIPDEVQRPTNPDPADVKDKSDKKKNQPKKVEVTLDLKKTEDGDWLDKVVTAGKIDWHDEWLHKATQKKYESIQFNLPNDVFQQILRIPEEIEIQEGDWTAKGQELNPHVTVLYGLNDTDVEEVEKIVKGIGSIEIKLGALRDFTANDDGIPLVIELESPQLIELHNKLAALPHVSTHPNYIPHICIGYLTPKAEGKEVMNELDLAEYKLEGTVVKLTDLVLCRRDKTQITLEKAAKRSKTKHNDWPNMERTNAYIGQSRLSPESKEAKKRMKATIERTFAKIRAGFKRKMGKAEDDELSGDTQEQIEREVLRRVEDDLTDMAPDIARELKAAAAAGTLMSVHDLDLTDSGMIEKINLKALEMAEKRGAELVGRRWEAGTLIDNPNAQYAITDTTRDAIKNMITDIFKGDTTIKEAKLQIAEALSGDGPAGIFSDYRAGMIAQKEIGNAQMGGQLEIWKELDIPKFLGWFVISDEPCDDCDSNDGVVVRLGEAFPDGSYSTMDSHPNCVCICSLMMSPDEGDDEEE